MGELLLSFSDLLVYSFFFLSISLNVGLVFYIRKILKFQGEKSYDVHALMQDLLNGAGLVKVERVDPADVLLRSPRFRQ